MQKHEAMNAYFEKMFTEMTAERIGALDIPKQDENYKDCIWICWWQGLENAPEIVKRCVASIQKHAGHHKIIMITDENYKEFISFPMWIEEIQERNYHQNSSFGFVENFSLSTVWWSLVGFHILLHRGLGTLF
jgi:hypothetical protein